MPGETEDEKTSAVNHAYSWDGVADVAPGKVQKSGFTEVQKKALMQLVADAVKGAMATAETSRGAVKGAGCPWEVSDPWWKFRSGSSAAWDGTGSWGSPAG
ncbi:unnamed protein product [Prorocentrum cordatum]|uniref:Uncharacterized protein n=1 Tax=Prorocentrum cordatum TaxID=2364126 RepID=A0ABN9XCG9_9DINO|nr:unnamed protein product [Polarella glacialis]